MSVALGIAMQGGITFSRMSSWLEGLHPQFQVFGWRVNRSWKLKGSLRQLKPSNCTHQSMCIHTERKSLLDMRHHVYSAARAVHALPASSTAPAGRTDLLPHSNITDNPACYQALWLRYSILLRLACPRGHKKAMTDHAGLPYQT